MIVSSFFSSKPHLFFLNPLKDFGDVNTRIHRVFCDALDNFSERLALEPILVHLPSARAIFSVEVVRFAETFLSVPFRSLRDRVVAMLPAVTTTFSYGARGTVDWTYYFVSCVLQRVVFNGFFQSTLCTELPRTVLERFAPEYKDLVDHKIAKIARVVITSSLYTLMHIVRSGDLPGMLIPQALSGVYAACVTEAGLPLIDVISEMFFRTTIHTVFCGG